GRIWFGYGASILFKRMKSLICLLGVIVAAGSAVGAERSLVHSFSKQVLTKEFWSEGATFGDFNKDGNVDIAAGPFWYEGPKFEKQHEFYPATQSFKIKKEDG